MQAQTLQDLDGIWKSILASEKAGLMMHSEDYDLLRMVKNRSTTPKEIPYPQMEILVDSMQFFINDIQEFRREVAGKRDRILEIQGKKEKIKSKSEAEKLFREIESSYQSSASGFDASNKKVAEFHQQFGNLKMLYGINRLTYDEYYKEFLLRLEDLENQLVAQSARLGKRRIELTEAFDAKDEELLKVKRGLVADLEEVHKLSENKIVQIQNFQDRLGTTTPDEEIYFGPGIDPPYELKVMGEEIAKLEEHFKIFKMFDEEQ